MASEITITAGLSVSKNGASVSGSGSLSLDMAGTEMTSLVQTLTTSEAALSLGGVDAVAGLFIKNLDSTNIAIIGLNNPITQILCVLQPGASMVVSGVSTTLYGKSGASTVDVFVVAVEA